MRRASRVCVFSMGVALTLFHGLPARADVVRLRDGTVHEGDAKRTPGGLRVTRADGTFETFSSDQIDSIELRPSVPSTVPTASTLTPSDAGKLASFRRSVDGLTDPKLALDRYEKFIDQNKSTPLAVEAAGDVSVWKDRLDRGLTKVGTKWFTPDERNAINAKAFERADEARQLMKSGRLRDAETALNRAVLEDPANAAALYLRGVLSYRTDRIPAARQYFELANSALSDHAPTLNNLGVVLWRQNQFVAALNWFDQGMRVAPLNQVILNNVAEALNGLPENMRKAPIAQRAARRFTEQDTQLQQKLATDGWYRWGSTWVTQAQLDQLKAAEKDITDKLDKMAGDFDVVQGRVRQLEADIESNNRTIRQLEASQVARDINGNIVRVPMPQVYYDLTDDNKRLDARRTVELHRLDDLRAAATTVKQQGPQPQFTGTQRLIGEEGTPVLLPVSVPTTTPATQPQ